MDRAYVDRAKLGAAIALLTLSGCAAEQGSAQEVSARGAVRVDTVAAREEMAAQPIDAVGLVIDRERTSLAFESGGRLASIRVDEGDVVRPGQVLARLDAGALHARQAQARAALAKAERDSARANGLHGSGALAPAAADDAATALELAEASLRLVRHHRSRSVLVAPHGGTVLRRLAEAGEVVGPGAPVLVLSRADDGRAVRLGVVDRDVVRIAIGDPAAVRLDALPSARFEGRVAEIAELPSPGTGTFSVEIALEDASIPRAGLVARATIEPSARSRVVLVPAEALFEVEGDRAFVFVLAGDGQIVERRLVRPSYLRGAEIAISEGLAGGDRVVVTGLSKLAQGARVAAITREERTP